MIADTALVLPSQRGPGMVPAGFAESIRAQAAEIDDPDVLWNGATTFAALAQKWNGHGHEKTEIKTAQMFCEILLAQLLGPRPGVEQGEDGRFLATVSHAIRGLDDLIPQPRVSELQRMVTAHVRPPAATVAA